MRAEVIEAKFEHCRMLAEAMDEAGIALIRKGWGVDPLSGLQAAFEISPLCWSIFLDETIVGMFGCAKGDARPAGGTVQPDLQAPEGGSGPGSATLVGNPWLTTAPGIEKVKLRFIRQSRPYIEKMRERYATLVSYAYKDNRSLLAWLQWSGFRVEETEGEFLKCVLEREVF